MWIVLQNGIARKRNPTAKKTRTTINTECTYAAFILLLFAGGWPSLLTKRICLGAGRAGDAPLVELMPSAAAQECCAHPPGHGGSHMGFGKGDGGDKTPHMMLMALEDEQSVWPMEVVADERGYFLCGNRSRAAAPQPLRCHLLTATVIIYLQLLKHHDG
jgi:hypothetical protein